MRMTPAPTPSPSTGYDPAEALASVAAIGRTELGHTAVFFDVGPTALVSACSCGVTFGELPSLRHGCPTPAARAYYYGAAGPFPEDEDSAWICPTCGDGWWLDWSRCGECGRLSESGPSWVRLVDPPTSAPPGESIYDAFPSVRARRGRFAFLSPGELAAHFGRDERSGS